MWAPLIGLLVGAAACNPTEPPFRNAYWDNYRPGLYVDAVNGEPLFSSRDKYDSGTGWPSFTLPIEPERVVTSSDWSFGALRTEVRASGSDMHLGHVFGDGPAPTGLRYCINSFALRFIPAEDLEGHGYREYHAAFIAPSAITPAGASLEHRPTIIEVELGDAERSNVGGRDVAGRDVAGRDVAGRDEADASSSELSASAEPR